MLALKELSYSTSNKGGTKCGLTVCQVSADIFQTSQLYCFERVIKAEVGYQTLWLQAFSLDMVVLFISEMVTFKWELLCYTDVQCSDQMNASGFFPLFVGGDGFLL